MEENKSKGVVVEQLRKKGDRAIILLSLLVLSANSFVAEAQSAQGAAAIGRIANDIRAYQDPVQSLVYAIALVLCIVGALKIAIKMWNGDQDVQKQIVMYFGGALALCALASLMPAMFA